MAFTLGLGYAPYQPQPLTIGEIDGNADGRFFVPVWNMGYWEHFTVQSNGSVTNHGEQMRDDSPITQRIRQAVVDHCGHRPSNWAAA